MENKRFNFSEDLEAGGDRSTSDFSRYHCGCRVWLQSGFHGVQDHHPEVQAILHSAYAMTAQAIDWLRECGFESLNVDLTWASIRPCNPLNRP